MLTTSLFRRRSRDEEDGVFYQVQYRHMDIDDGTAVCGGVVVQKGRGVLPSAGMVWSSRVVAVVSLCSGW